MKLWIGISIFFVSVLPSQAAAPSTIGYQGVLTDGNNQVVADGSYSVTFKLYTASSGGSALWTETQSVSTTRGVFTAVLGSSTALSISFEQSLWLGIAISGGSELSPRVQLSGVPYSMTAQGVADNAVTSAKIADGTVASGDIADGTVTTTDIADATIATADLADNAVTAAKISDGTITAADIAGTQVVKSVNALTDAVTLAAGSNVTITPSGNTLTIAASGGGTGNTLDAAYDQGGAGAGRTITADNGAVDIQGTGGLTVTGKVGIGYNAPTQLLDVRDNTAGAGARIRLDGDNGASDGGSGVDLYYGNAIKWSIFQRNQSPSHALAFSTGAVDYSLAKMLIETDGDVGIGSGNSTLASRLYVKGSGNTSGTSALNVTNSDGNSILFAQDDRAVGIGTAVPIAGKRLTVKASADNTMDIILQKHNSTNEIVRIGEYNEDGVVAIYDSGVNSFNHWLEGNDGSQSSLAVLASSKLGIGVSTPAAKLEVEGGAVLFDGTTGSTPVSGAGTRLMWIPAKAAFRAGKVAGTQWDDASVGSESTVGGGEDNTASGQYTTIGGGINNTAAMDRSTIGGGTTNATSGGGINGTIGGGNNNTVGAGGGTIAGGSNNTVSATSGMIPGGDSNAVTGAYGFAAGRRAKANHNGAFVWGDQTDADFASTAVDQFLIRAAGGVGIGTTSPAAPLDVARSTDGQILYLRHTGGKQISYSLTTATASMTSNGALSFATSGSDIMTFATNATEVMRILSSGNVGIGTTSPGEKLDVEASGATVAAFNRNTDDGTLISLQRDGSEVGTIVATAGVVTYNAFTGSHYAWTHEAIEMGALVMLTGNNRHLHGDPEAEILYGIAPSATANNPQVLGAYLGLQEAHQADDDSNPHLVMAVGNGQMWVVANGEDIEIGDYLISADVVGHAMKDPGTYQTSHIVARAAEKLQWSEVDYAIAGRKRAKISVFFESFTRHNAQRQIEDLQVENQQLRSQLDQLAVAVERLEALSARTEDDISIAAAGQVEALQLENALLVKRLETLE